jgi:hypothetical protein
MRVWADGGAGAEVRQVSIEPSQAEVRAECREWLAGHWDPERPLSEWRALLADSGWAVPDWPSE